jgi:PKHD-type hydroxylase
MSLNYFIQQERNNVDHLNYYYFVDAFTPKEIIEIRQIGDALPQQRGSVIGDNIEETEYRVSDISWIPNESKYGWLFDKLSEYAYVANKNMWNFDIWGYGDELQYTTYYDNGGHYDWHADLGPGISNRKMSMVLQLSDPGEYDGGELQFNNGGGILSVERKLGVLCFFPSFLLHRVTPVTAGVRKSLVTWYCGSNFR